MYGKEQVVNIQSDKYAREPIAIIGMGCRFPGGANNPDAFWKILRDGVDAITDIPSDRWDISSYYDPNRAKPGKTNTHWGGFLEQIDHFDAKFFGISPREASLLDPQQRLLLEVCWEALEDGGQVTERLAGTRTGVFMGGFTLDYKLLQFAESNRHMIDSHSATGTMMTLLANRISYIFDFRGPSVSLDTACSSSLVAVHLACQSIWNGESSLALAGGVNAMLKPDYFIAESKAGMLSADGRSKAFDSRANGYVRGEGAGVVVLKPLSQALEDGDPIHAIIRGTGVNQDGHSNGITVPSGDAQQELMRTVYQRAGVSPGEVQYVEAHGTGTPVGDPIEANALGKILSTDRPEGSTCYIGSVKTNIGHTEAAAGIAGLIKAVMAIKHREIPPHLHLINVNPQIKLEELKLKIPRELTPWPKTEGPLLAGVNSFGFGGTNAHVVLEEAPQFTKSGTKNPETSEEREFLIPISTRSEGALKEFATSCHAMAIDQTNNAQLHEIGYSMAQCRDHHEYRLAMVVNSKEELAQHLEAYLAGETRSGMHLGYAAQKQINSLESVPKMAFVFTGMGPQWWAMGRQLMKEEPVFREAIEKCDELLSQYTGWSLLEEMQKDESESRMEETEVSQPANFAIQVALAELWHSWGIQPDAIVGHSAGEVAAAYIAGAMSFEEAVRVIYHRSRLQQKTTGQGKLVAVGLPLEEAKELINDYQDQVSIAAINSPSAVTLVGDPKTLQLLTQTLEEKGVFFKFLRVNVPYHSHYMEPFKEELFDVLKDIELQSTSLPLYSTVSGKQIDGKELNADYWWKNVREPVYFAHATDELINDGYNVFVEIGPHPVLASSISECLMKQGLKATILTSMKRGAPERATVLESLGALYTLGYQISWEQFYRDGEFIKYPSYPWQRERYWHESNASSLDRLGGDHHPLLGRRLKSPYPTWEMEIDTWRVPFLDDHRIQGTVVFPGAGYVEMGLSAIREVYGDGDYVLNTEDIEFKKALFLPEGQAIKLRLILNPKDASFGIYSSKDTSEEWTLHASGKVKPRNIGAMPKVAISELQKNCQEEISREKCYVHFRTLGLEYGVTFQGIQQLWQGENEALAHIEIPEEINGEVSNFRIHPAVLDVCFQVLAAALPLGDEESKENTTVYMPIGVEQGAVYRQLSQKMWIHASIKEQDAKGLKGDIRLIDEKGNLVLEIQGCRAVSLKDQTKGTNKPQDFYEIKWLPQMRHEASETSPVNQTDAGSWLIFSDTQGVGESLAQQLEQKGEHYVMIYPGESYGMEASKKQYWVNPTNPDDFTRLLQDVLGQEKAQCRGVVHLWSLHATSAEKTTLESLKEAENLGVIAVLHLVQSMANWNWRKKPQLWLVTRGSQLVGDVVEPLEVAQSALWGLARSVGHQEHKDIWGGIIDLDHKVTDSCATVLFEEIWNADEENQVAFRNGERYIARLLESTDLSMPLPPTFHADGSYLITGGLGGLGLLVSRWMIERGARRLILVGRENLPPRSTWNQIEPGTILAERIAAVRELEAMGASVHVTGFDISNEAQLAAFIEDYEKENWPMIRGIVHSAGVARPQLMMQMDQEIFSNVLRPKVMGAWNLHRQFADKPLDFFIMFSSIAAVVVSAGQANYSAANSFLDALAHHRKALGMPGLSINWGPWGEVGMATQLDLIEYFEKRGFYPMTNEQGLEALGSLLGQKPAQVTVVAANWPVVAEMNFPMGIAPIMLDELVTKKEGEREEKSDSGQKVGILQELAKSSEEESRYTLLENYLLEVASTVLRMNKSNLLPEQPLNAWGLDSMIAIEMKNRIEMGLGVSVAVVELLKGSSVAQLTKMILPQLQLDEMTVDEETADILAEAENLSLEEVEALLHEIAAGEVSINE